jgi:outer membrane protein assembly factor BamB
MAESSPNSRGLWAQVWTRIAWIAGGTTLLLAALLAVNSFQLYSGPGNAKVRLVEARELAPLKAALRLDPQNEETKQEIRRLDQQLRHDYFRREALATRGAWVLLGAAVWFLVSLQLAARYRRTIPAVTRLSPHPPDPWTTARVSTKAVAGTTLVLAGLGASFVWNGAPQWRDHATTAARAPTTAATETAPSHGIDADWFASDGEIAANWPRFRGPNGSGITTLKDLPASWDGESGKNIRWKTRVELPGENSPVVWGDRVYLTGADERQREVYCFDANDGTLLWKQSVGTPQSARAEPPEVLEDTGFAAPTAVTDGRRVFAIFANGDIAGFTAEGANLWTRSLGTPVNLYGHATSLEMWRNRVIVVFDQGEADAGKSRILALDANTGATVWETPRPVANSWVSPILIRHEDREQIITSADPWVISYDPATGAEWWRAECMHGDVAPSPAFSNGMVYAASDQGCIAGIRVDGTGTLDEKHIIWKQEETTLPDTCSLLCDGPRLYTLVYGVLYAFDAKTGEALWEFETDFKFDASPTLVDGRIHLSSTTGETIIGVAGPDGFEEIGRAAIGEGAGASPAFAPGRIYLRGKKHLFCIAHPDEK